MSTVASASQTGALPKRTFGKTGVDVPILGLGTAPGGFGLNDFDAVDVIHAAIDHGITYLDTAPGYDRAQIQLGEVLPQRRDEVFLVTKTFAADGKQATEILEQSLRDMKTDCVDLTFVHSVGSLEPEEILAPNGSLEALRDAQKRGLTKHVGFTAHHWPAKSLRILEEAEIDAVMLAINFVDKHTYDFQGAVLEQTRSKNVGVAAMKVFGGAPEVNYEKPTKSLMAESGLDHRQAMHYALSLPGVSTAVVGMFTVEEVEENVGYAKSYSEMSPPEVDVLETEGAAVAKKWKDHFGQVS